MKIPKKIRIGGQDVDIIFVDQLPDACLGQICLAMGTMEIANSFNDKKQSETSKIQTFIHEVVHGILDTMGEDKLSRNEKFVNTFVSLFVDVIEEIIKANKNDWELENQLRVG